MIISVDNSNFTALMKFLVSLLCICTYYLVFHFVFRETGKLSREILGYVIEVRQLPWLMSMKLDGL